MQQQTHTLLYCAAVPVKDIRPLMPLEHLLEKVNEVLPRLDGTHQNLIAKVVRLNWMIDNLKTNKIIKPLLVQNVNGQLTTMTGDTRLQALQFHTHVKTVSCLLSVAIDDVEQYPNWIVVNSDEHLAALLNIRPKDIHYHNDWQFGLIDWIEFSVAESAHHLHDEQERYEYFKEWFCSDKNPAGNNCVIDEDWLTTPHDFGIRTRRSYWENPRVTVRGPDDINTINEQINSPSHRLYYTPDFKFKQENVYTPQTLDDLCTWANQVIHDTGIRGMWEDEKNFYDAANLVKINMWVNDIREQGIVKPMLLSYMDEQYAAQTGESRMRALECLPVVNDVRTFITTNKKHSEYFESKGYTPVTDFDVFAHYCGAIPGLQFEFTFTDNPDDYGIFWYEYNAPETRKVTPDEQWCVEQLKLYLEQNPDTVFTKEWFKTPKFQPYS